jgi:polysaccharide pyruvyl transferase WcaK-like protein
MYISKNILVFCFYNKQNIGDDLFCDAFKYLFPNCNFTFTDKITILDSFDAVFIGGGSFLNEAIKIEPHLFNKLKELPIFYIGVGAETKIHETHTELLKLAKLIAIRTPEHLDKIKKLNSNVIAIPDLVYSLPANISSNKIEKSILYIPNILVVPNYKDPHWMHTSWEYFKSEFAQFLDEIKDEGYTLNIFPMSCNYKVDDRRASAELINKSFSLNSNELLDKETDFNKVINLFSKYSLVITQRFHGIILANIANVPVISIYHHDKLKDNQYSLSYYGFKKSDLRAKINLIENSNYSANLPIKSDTFKYLVDRVRDALCRH